MNVMAAVPENLKNIMSLVQTINGDMQNTGSDQWDDFYPDIQTITNDLKNNTLYILRDQKKCIGMIILNEEQDKKYKTVNWACKNDRILVLHRLCIHPARRGKGLAKKLMNFAEEYAIKNNYKSIRLDTYLANVAAVRLYE